MNTKLSKVLNEDQKARIEEVIEIYKSLPTHEVKMRLWNLTYRPEFALEKMGLTGQEGDEIFLKHYKGIRKELAEATGVCKIYNVNPTLESEVALQNVLGDKFAFLRITEGIESAMLHYEKEELKRICYLLSSQKENNYYGGLKSLKLKDLEAKFFFPYIGAIAKYYSERFSQIDWGDEAVAEAQEDTATAQATVAEAHKAEVKAKKLTTPEATAQFVHAIASAKNEEVITLITDLEREELIRNSSIADIINSICLSYGITLEAVSEIALKADVYMEAAKTLPALEILDADVNVDVDFLVSNAITLANVM